MNQSHVLDGLPKTQMPKDRGHLTARTAQSMNMVGKEPELADSGIVTEEQAAKNADDELSAHLKVSQVNFFIFFFIFVILYFYLYFKKGTNS